jgi:hypothetical protein
MGLGIPAREEEKDVLGLLGCRLLILGEMKERCVEKVSETVSGGLLWPER